MPELPDWACALGPPLFAARIRSTPEDFVVDELLDVEFSGEGEHDWLRVEKIGANTTWVAERLAEHAGVAPRDVGYAGLKDRHAETRQWFSVRRSSAAGTDWAAFEADGVSIVDRQRHRRKLKRGAHRGNTFRIALRADGMRARDDAISARLAQVELYGVPNYFGEQRFGRDGGNVDLGRAVIAGRRVSRHKRSIGLSAIRSLHFNDELSARVEDGTWNRMLPGDTANLDGSGSVFAVEEVTHDLEHRCAEMDIHPCGLLPEIPEARVAASYRPLRLPVRYLRWQIEDDALWLEFRLGKGSYATAVLREIASV